MWPDVPGAVGQRVEAAEGAMAGLASVRSADLVGAIAANLYMLLIIALFIARMMGRPQLEHWIGLAAMSLVLPLIYLFIAGLGTDRRAIYFAWLGLMALFLAVELTIDYILKLDFRSVQWAVIPYVMLFFGATGGMIGVAAQAGRGWASLTVSIFLVMAVLAFVQRAKTGM